MSECSKSMRTMLDELAAREGTPVSAAADIETAIRTSDDLRVRMRSTRLASMFLSCGIALAACAQPPPASSAPVDRLEGQSASSHLTPPVTAAELRERFFTLARGLRARGDTDVVHVEEVMGIKLLPNQEYRSELKYGGIVKEGWKYYVLWQQWNHNSIPDFRFMLTDEKGLHKGDCVYELHSFSRGLVDAGFKNMGVSYPPAKRKWLFNKDIPEAGIGFSITLFPSFPSRDDDRECVSWMTVGYGELR